jgi:hypothetical protein
MGIIDLTRFPGETENGSRGAERERRKAGKAPFFHRAGVSKNLVKYLKII